MLALLFLLLFAGSAEAATRYVDGNIASTCGTYSIASRNCSGSDGNAYKTFEEGLAALAASDTLYVRSGTYTKAGVYGNIAGDSYGGGAASWGAATTISNYGTETFTFNNDGLNMDNSVSTGGISYIIWTCDEVGHCIFQGTGGDESGFRLNNAAHHVRFQRLQIQNFTQHGIQGGTGGCPSGPSDIEILDSLIQNVGDDNDHFEHGIYPACSTDWVIAGNRFIGNMGYGIHVYASTANWHLRAIIRNNYIEGRKTGATSTAYGIAVATGSGHKVYNNIVNGQGSQAVKLTGGVQLFGAMTAPLIYNNTFYDMSIGVEVGDATVSAADIKNNIFETISTPVSDGGTSTTRSTNFCDSAGTGCSVTGSPSFVNPGTDFSLQAGSSCRDAGLDLSATLTTDYIGTARPQNGTFDIGAYEYIVTVPPSDSNGTFTRGGKGMNGRMR